MTSRAAPRPGDIWSHRYSERRVRILDVYTNDNVRVKTVALFGKSWQFKRGACASTVSGFYFSKTYQLLVRAA